MEKASMCKRLFSILLSCALAPMMLPATAFADNSDTGAPLPPQDSVTTGISGDGTFGNPYIVTTNADFVAVLNNQAADTVYIKLGQNISANVVIPAGKTVNLDLDNYTLTNAGDHTIVNNGVLTVVGNGTVDNVTHAKAALYNNGTAVLNGGTFSRSAEASTSASSNGGNSWYVIFNAGDLTIQEDAFVKFSEKNPGKFSSMIINSSVAENPIITIDGGTFVGGLNTVKNEKGAVTINGGSFSNTEQYVFYNYGALKITDGKFTSKTDSVIRNWKLNPSDEGSVVISGGAFTAPSSVPVLVNVDNDDVDFDAMGAPEGFVPAEEPGIVGISGGTFSSDMSEFVATGYTCKASGSEYTVEKIADSALVLKPGSSAEEGTTSAKLDGTFDSSTTNVDTSGDASEESKPTGAIAGNTVSVILPEVENANSASLTIAASTAISMANNSGSLVIESGLGKMEVSNEALRTISENAAGSDVVLNVEKIDVNTYELSATADGKDVFEESRGIVRVSVPLPTGVTDSVFVYWLGSDNVELMSGARVESGRVVWETNHFSTYYIAAEEQKAFVSDASGTVTFSDFDSALSSLSDKNGDVVIGLLDDVEMSVKANIERNVTINGNGNTITGEADNADVNFEVKNGTFAINNVTLAGFGSKASTKSGIAVVKVPDAADSDTKVVASDVKVINFCRSAYDIRSGSFEITGGIIDSGAQATGENSRLTKGIMAGYGSSPVTGVIAGTAITNTDSSYSDWDSAGIEIYQNANVVISDCTIDNVQNGIHVDNYYAAGNGAATAANAVVQNTDIKASNNAVIVFGKESNAPGTASVSVTGGVLVGDVKIQDGSKGGSAYKDAVALSGVTVKGNVTNEGGSFGVNDARVIGTVNNAGTMGVVNSAIDKVEGESGTITYVNSTVGGVSQNTSAENQEAMVNGVMYDTLAEAVDAANSGDVITLLNDVTLNGEGKNDTQGLLEISGKNVILDGNGKTISAAKVVVQEGNKGPSMINITSGANVTVKNLFIDGAGTNAGTTIDNTKHGLNVYEATVVVESVKVSNGNGYGVVVNGSTATINGLTTFNNGWGGIDVDSKSGAAILTVNNADIAELNSVRIENSSSTNPDPVVAIKGGSFEFLTKGNEISTPNLVISGGTFSTDDNENAIDIESYLEEGLVLGSDGKVTRPSSGGGAPAVKVYAVTIGEFANGKVTSDAAKAEEGDTVTLTATPEEGFELAFIAVVGPDGEEVELTANADGTYSFEMPGFDVEVKASFACDGEELCPSHGFTDVDEGEWYHAAIDWAVSNKVLNGIGDTGLMMPNGDVTRAQMAAILWNVEGNPEVAYGGEFSDVADGDWFEGAVAWACSKGLFVGYEGSDRFGPNDVLTREQAAAVLMRWSRMRGEETSARADLSAFADASDVDVWAKECMSWAVAEGVLNGVEKDDGSRELQPLGTATRAQAAALMMNLLNKE